MMRALAMPSPDLSSMATPAMDPVLGDTGGFSCPETCAALPSSAEAINSRMNVMRKASTAIMQPPKSPRYLSGFGGRRAAIRRKPGTDTKFPAQFAGNWLSVPGFALRNMLPVRCAPKRSSTPRHWSNRRRYDEAMVRRLVGFVGKLILLAAFCRAQTNPSRYVEIKLPPEVISETFFVRYVLGGRTSALGFIRYPASLPTASARPLKAAP